jgi:hypothetical protein
VTCNNGKIVKETGPKMLNRATTSRPLINCIASLTMAASLLVASAAMAVPAKRALPDYDGRGGEKTTPSDVILWVPRVALFPLYVVSEYVIRRPLGAMISGAERAHIPDALYNFFLLGEEHKAGWVPTFFVDFGFKPSAGLYFFWDDALARGNDLRFHAATWGTHWLAGSVTDRIHLNRNESLTFQFSGIRRPDYRYYGEGPNAIEGNLSRYGADRIEASAGYGIGLGGASRIETNFGWRRLRFREPEEYRSSSTVTRVTQGAFSLPNGFEEGYSAGFSRASLRLDSRGARPASQTGLRLDIEAEQGSAPRSSSPSGWLRYGAIAGGFLDLNDRARVVSLSVATLFSDPLVDGPVPFTELVQLGGSEPMRGFVPGRLFGRSALVTTLGYHWPIWVWLDGTVQAAVGNVYGEHLRDFDPNLLRFSGALGFKTAGMSDNPVEFLVGFGTETFERGAQLNSLRLVFGTSRGF